jgi:prepilin-type N-terminal cleavage/methylation domain-containing protein
MKASLAYSAYKRRKYIISLEIIQILMKNNLKKGFTLIELLVVIAIIGILSSVVLASLQTARTKGSDAAVKSGMDSLRSQAALYYDAAGSTYGTAGTGCAVAGTVFASTTAIIANITSNAAAAPICTVFTGGSSFTTTVLLKGGTTWCTDPTNSMQASSSASSIAAAGVCS